MASGTQSKSLNYTDPRLTQADRVMHSTVLQGSEALCLLLRFLVSHSIAAPDTPVKEFQIATEVLGRSTNFDPRLDSAVRVQMSRLRAKLSEYYNTIGRDDALLIDIPKGGHTVVFRTRESLAQPPSNFAPAPPAPSGARWKWVATGLAVLFLGSVSVAAWALVSNRPMAHSVGGLAPNSATSKFWQGVLPGADEPLVVFSNAEFFGRPETGLRYFQPGADPADSVFDHYTGVGEVLSVHQLDQTFANLGRHLRVKRGRLLNWDDVKGRDVVFLGSPSENLSLRELSLGQDFRFETLTTPPRAGDLGIVNLHPGPGEQLAYAGSKALPITEDYALVELSRGGADARTVLMLAGTTTFGTEAAVEFVCDDEHVAQLLSQLAPAGGALSSFTALLHVKVQRGVPVETALVIVRPSRPRQ